MRAATVFTGAAGLAIGFGPTAMAAARPAPTQGHSARATGTTAANIQLTAADTTIESKNCTTNTWLHISWHSPATGHFCKQFGYAGFKDVYSVSGGFGQCGGNNYGEVWYEPSANNYTAIPYGPGKTYRHLNGSLSAVSISHWKGTDECPWAT
jgi:hypothetical protein